MIRSLVSIKSKKHKLPVTTEGFGLQFKIDMCQYNTYIILILSQLGPEFLTK